jgi:Cu(I)/Ag(I) efflux system membrane fusion protein
MNPTWKKLASRIDLVPTILFAALLVTALIFLDEIRSWFSLAPEPDPPPAETAAPTASRAEPRVEVAKHRFSDASLQALRGALGDYDELRAGLADDSMKGIDEEGRAIADWIRRASAEAQAAPEPIARMLLDAGAAAERVAAAGDLESARRAFGELSKALVMLSTSDERLQEGRHVFACSMVKEGYDRWLQVSATVDNPYMGSKMPTCGTAARFEALAAEDGGIVSHEGHGHEGSDVAYFTCSMHPSVREKKPGNCPICGMELTPVTFDEAEGGVILVDEGRRQLIGVRLGEVTRAPMKKTIRAIGKLTYDETKLVDVTLKYDGWINKVHADAVGVRVKRGGPLFSVYSPEIYAAQGELLTAMRGPKLARGKDSADPFVAIARERLALLDAYGLDKHLEKTGKAVKYITVTSPATGYVVEKNVFDGSAFKAGTRVMRIAGLDTVWLEAELYEHELPLVKEGDVARVSLSYVAVKSFEGKVTFVYPYLDPKSRTGRVRIELDNEELALKPDMYANVELAIDLGERLRVPDSAVIYTGRRRLVFVDLGEGRLRPQEVELGVRAGDAYEVLAGLEEGQRVVTSGNFLIAAESRIRSAARYWQPADDKTEESPETIPGSEARDHSLHTPRSDKPSVTPRPQAAPKATAKPKAKPEPATIYWCPMHHEVTSPTPGKCPKCGMPLEPKP